MNTSQIHLVIVAIERGARLMNIAPQEMYRRLKTQGLIEGYLLAYYDVLHTQSIEWLAETTVETLKNWEAAQ